MTPLFPVCHVVSSSVSPRSLGNDALPYQGRPKELLTPMKLWAQTHLSSFELLLFGIRHKTKKIQHFLCAMSVLFHDVAA